MRALEAYARASAVVVELGTEFGIGSTAAFQRGMAANPEARCWVSVDRLDQILPERRPVLPYWHLVIGDSRSPDTVAEAKAHLGNDRPDLIFIDTHHTYEVMAAELAVWSPLAAPSCTWLFHDTWMLGKYNRMTDAIREFAARNSAWYYADLSRGDNGLGALFPRR